jgi:hypothetical protein
VQTRIEVYDNVFDTYRKILTRRVVYDVVGQGRLPRCAWCRLADLRPLADIIQRGFTIDFVQTVAFCDQCHKGTIVVYEMEIETEREVE